MIGLTTLWFLGLVLLAVAAAELAARLWFRRGAYYVFRPNTRQIFLPDLTIFPQLEPEVHIRYNEDGERGESVPTSGRVFRVLVAGDSIAECYHVDQATSWPGVLERDLSRPARQRLLGADHVHVGNVGRSSADSGSVRRILTGVLPNYAHLDAIVLMVGASDVLRWLEIGAPADRPAPVLPVSECFDWSPAMTFGLPPSRTAIAETIRRVRDRVRRPKPVVGRGRWMARARAERAAAKEVRREIPDARVVIDTFDSNLRALITLCRAAAPLVIVVRPPWFEKESFTPEEEALFWNGGVGQADRETISIFYSSEVLFALFRAMDARCVAVAESLGTALVDVRPGLEMSARCFIDHVHVTARGSATVAHAIAGAIEREFEHGDPHLGAARDKPSGISHSNSIASGTTNVNAGA